MNRNLIKSFLRYPSMRHTSNKKFCSSVNSEATLPPATQPSPIIIKQDYENLRVTTEVPREAWIENLNSTKGDNVGLVSLHPDIFGTVPRLDIIHENVVWQRKYKFVNFKHAKVPVEMRGPGKGYGRKPWPQKGTGRARHGSTRGPQWVKGGTVHGPRMFTSQFYMLPFVKRMMGLTSTLSCKFIQDDLKIVTSFDIPSDEPQYLEDLVEERVWGNSVLFVDADDQMPRNITLATDEIPHFNLLPVYGLNVHSMLKHDTLVLTVAALKRLEERLIYHLNRPDKRPGVTYYQE